MFARIYAIARNTLSETIRQPVFGVILVSGMALIALSPAFTMFTLVNSIKMVKDMGLATVFLGGMLLAVAASSSVIYQEIRNQTAVTVISKPVDRFEFILGKYLGIILALLAAGYLMTIVLMMTVRVGVPETVRTHLDRMAIAGEIVAFLLAMGGALIMNYFFDRPFPSAAILFGLGTFTAAFWSVGVLPTPTRELQNAPFHYDWSVAVGSILVMLAISVVASVAIAASTRLNPLVTLAVCLGFLALGLVGHETLGRISSSRALDVGYALILNLQYLWVADVLWAEKTIPWEYVWRVGLYAFVYQLGILFLAFMLFQDREVTG